MATRLNSAFRTKPKGPNLTFSIVEDLGAAIVAGKFAKSVNRWFAFDFDYDFFGHGQPLRGLDADSLNIRVFFLT